MFLGQVDDRFINYFLIIIIRFLDLLAIASLCPIKTLGMAESPSSRTGTSATPLWKPKLSKIRSFISCFSVSYREQRWAG